MNKQQFYETVNKTKLEDIINKNPTPCYIYFQKHIDKKFNDLKFCLPPSFKIHYALKANPNKKIVKHIRSLGIGADVASMGEIKIAIDCGISPNCIEFSGPGKSNKELEFAINNNLASINVESISELKKINKISLLNNKKVKVGIRINPNPKELKAGLSMSGDSQFGIHENSLEKAIEFIKNNQENLHFTGIHVHSGSQLLSADAIINNFQNILDLSLKIEKNYNVEIKKINFGGGWGINYFPNQKKLDLKKLKNGLSEIFNSEKNNSIIEGKDLIIEPGRFLTGECGIYVTSALYTKIGLKKKFIIVDGGMHHNYLLAGGMGQVIRRNFEIDIISEKKYENKKQYEYDIAGCLCTPQDILAIDFKCDDEIQEGDKIIFFNTGAYGYSASPLNFISHSLPREIYI